MNQTRKHIHPYLKHPRAIAEPWTVPALCAAYRWAGQNAAGGKIAIIEMGGGWLQSDIATYFSGIGQPMPSITDVSVDGTTNTYDPDPQSADYEVALDIEVAGASYYAVTGNPATIRIYWTQDMALAITQAVADGCAVMSISWGADEAQWASADITNLANASAAATAAGMTIFAASGDNDSSDGGPTPANVDLPSSCPNIVGCGGTTKTTSSEVVWNNNPGNASGEGTGGGYSTMFPRPTWQTGIPLPPSGLGRMVPDCAANADPNTGYYIYVHGGEVVVGGTSAVAPLYAGLFAAINAHAGQAAAKFYSNLSCFTDITSGDNGTYNAGLGPDPCTGCGAPIGLNLSELFVGAAAPPQPSPTPTPTPSPMPPPPPSPTPKPTSARQLARLVEQAMNRALTGDDTETQLKATIQAILNAH